MTQFLHHAATRVAAAIGACAVALAAGVVPAGAVARGPASTPAVLAQIAPPVDVVATLPPGWPEGPAASATAYLLLDARTGQLLAARNPDTRRPVASTVKTLTALTVLASHSLDEVVVIGSEVAGIGGASTGLAPGQTRTVGELLDALLVRSGNDAAVALAVYAGGSVEAFAVQMREEAARLGVVGATIVTPSGLDDANLLSARDLAAIARAALSDPRFRAIAARRSVVIDGRAQPNRNELIETYPGATGLKTGFTDAAGYAVIGSAERNGHEFIAVVLGARSSSARFAEAAALLDHAFLDFTATALEGRSRLRRAGQWVGLGQPRGVAFFAPRDQAALAITWDVPIVIADHTPGAAVTGFATLDVRWQGAPLGTVRLSAGATPRPEVAGEAAVGRWLWDRAYEAMRAVPPTR